MSDAQEVAQPLPITFTPTPGQIAAIKFLKKVPDGESVEAVIGQLFKDNMEAVERQHKLIVKRQDEMKKQADEVKAEVDAAPKAAVTIG